jgi:hypothetical protein
MGTATGTIMNGEKFVFNNITNNYYSLQGGLASSSLASPPQNFGL